MRSAIRIFALVLIALLGGFLLGGAFLAQTSPWKWGIVPALALFLLGLMGFYRKNYKNASFDYPKADRLLRDTAAITCAAVLTHWLQGSMNVVLASAAVGLIGAMTMKDHESEIFLGSFIGMASATLFPLYAVAAAGLFGGLIYTWLKPWLHHAGGKLGFLAFLSIYAVSTFQPSSPFLLGSGVEINGVFFVISLLSVVVVQLLKGKFQQTGVFASAAVGVVLGLFWMFVSSAEMQTAMVIAYGATFVGMTSKKILSESMVLLGAFVYPMMYVLFSPLFQGYGGKLGMIALLTTTLLHGLIEIARMLETKRNQFPDRKEVVV
jgi:hypothetical protein